MSETKNLLKAFDRFLGQINYENMIIKLLKDQFL